MGDQATTESLTVEFTLRRLSSEISKLIDPAVKYIDESRAKKLRREWEELQPMLADEGIEASTVQEQLESLRQKIHQQVENRNARFAEIEARLKSLKAAIANDDLQTSQQLEQQIIRDLNRTRGLSGQRQQAIIQGLEALQPKIKKLVSWRHWGTAKAREQVIEEIRRIHDIEKDLEKVARRIKLAREQWKQWDNSGEGGDKKLYEAFDKACSDAYAPCKQLFDNQRKQREAASKHRKLVCEKLEQQYENTDWRNPEWKTLQQFLREQTARWRQLGPAEYRDRKPLQKRYDEIIRKFDGPLDRERKRNLRQRQALIQGIHELLELEDSRRAVNELQKLKRNWIVTVSGKRKQEQAIWKQFTAACDAIYDKGRASKKALDKALEDQLKVKQALCDEIETVIRDQAEQLDHDALNSRIKTWKKRWTESGRVPKTDARSIEKRFRGVMRSAENLLVMRKSARRERRNERLFEHARLCAELEAAVLEDELDSSDKSVDQFNARRDSLHPLDETLARQFDKRWNLAISAIKDSSARAKLVQGLDHNFDRANALLLHLEIKAAVDSPPEFAKQRMALQIDRLSAAMGKAHDAKPLDTADLVDQIHLIGAVLPAQQALIDKRFIDCYQIVKSDT